MLQISNLRQAIGLAMAILLTSCGQGSTPERPQQAATPSMPAFFPPQALVLPGPPELVLAEGDHGIELTLGEYNGRAFDEKLPADLDTLTARTRYLGMLLDIKVAAVEARLRGYAAKDAPSLVEHERELAQRVLQQSILAANNIPDAEAVAFVRDHPEEFPGVDSAQAQGPGDLMHAKYKMQDRVLREQLEGWKAREHVVIHSDRIDALVAAASDSSVKEIHP